jgi:AcrR family transcriptional regulator
MPKQVDPRERRRQLAEALWRITRRDGWDAVSLRRVAAEAGVSMGMVQHYFTTKDQMLQFALEMIGEEYQERITRQITALPTPHDPRRVVQIVLEELLPRDDRGRVEVQAAAAFLGRAVLHPQIATAFVAAGATLTRYLADHLPTAEAERDAAGLLALVDGLIAHTLTGRQTLTGARAILNTHLDRIFR